MYSAEIAGDEEDEETARKNEQLTEEERSAKKAKEDKQFKWLLYITVAISMVVSVAAFMFLPYVLASLIRGVGASEFLVTIVEAFVKLALFMGYMFLISRMKDIQRTFMYHGAEHKCINCVEHGLPLTVENVLKSSRLHKRCGTSFLFLVMLVSIVLHFMFVAVPFYWVRLLGRLLMVPVVAGISFEIIQWAGRTDSKFADIMSKPGLAMQKFTTKEPAADMAEVAIKAVEAVFDWRAYLKRNLTWTSHMRQRRQKMQTLESLLKKGTTILKDNGLEEAGLDAWLLLEFKTGKNRAYYFAHGDEPVSDETAAEYLTLIDRRAGHIPVQQLTHQAFFMGYEFYVNENVLIPRQDTETLVEEALKHLGDVEKPEILDMCTGSGCILLSLLLERQDACGTGVDVSPEALEVAKKNAGILKVENRADFVESDLFSAPYFCEKGGKDSGKYDILISNPPYIATEEIETLMEEVRLHDPRKALDGMEDGLYFYRKITAEAGRYLKPGGWLLYEIGCTQGEAVSTMMKAAGFTGVQIVKDLPGLDRVVLGQKQEEIHV